jgi:hypothetical protein
MGRIGPINCQSHFTIPADTQPGIYAMYWVWDFTKLTAVDPTYLELYTSCMDVEVVADDDSSAASSGGAGPSTTPQGGGESSSIATVTHITTVFEPPKTVTKRVSRSTPANPDVVVKTIYTQKFITVTVSA